jgi:hypothetical protein
MTDSCSATASNSYGKKHWLKIIRIFPEVPIATANEHESNTTANKLRSNFEQLWSVSYTCFRSSEYSDKKLLKIAVENWCYNELSFRHCELRCLGNDSGAPKVLPQTSQQNLVTQFCQDELYQCAETHATTDRNTHHKSGKRKLSEGAFRVHFFLNVTLMQSGLFYSTLL